MDFYPYSINFGNIIAVKEPHKLERELASDPSKATQLMSYVRNYYSSYNDYEIYQEMINIAIKSNNIIGLHILWKGIYYHDRDSPSFSDNLVVATRCSNLAMFLQVLEGYTNWNVEEADTINYDALLKVAETNENTSVFEFVRDMGTEMGKNFYFGSHGVCVSENVILIAEEDYIMSHDDDEECTQMFRNNAVFDALVKKYVTNHNLAVFDVVV